MVALLHNAVGPRATKDVVEWLLEQLEGDEEWEPAAQGTMINIMGQKSIQEQLRCY